MTNDPRHPHEPEIPPTLDDEGRCLVCVIMVERDGARAEVERQTRRADVFQADAAKRVAENDRLTEGIRELWETWMNDEASWVEVAGTLDELHTSLDAAGDDREDGQ